MMEQTSFLPPPPFAPTWPQPGTLADKALEILMTGQGLTHPQFEAVTFSWRLAAIVGALRELGWPVLAEDVPAPTFETPHRTIARYRLAPAVIEQARAIRHGGE